MRDVILFVNGHLRKGQTSMVGWHKDGIPTKAAAGLGSHNRPLALTRKENGIRVGSRTKGQGTDGRRRLVLVGRQYIVQSLTLEPILKPLATTGG